jgi:hypothetical protein
MNKKKSTLKEITNLKNLQILHNSSALAIKGGDDKRPPRPIGSGGGLPILPNSMNPYTYSYEI